MSNVNGKFDVTPAESETTSTAENLAHGGRETPVTSYAVNPFQKSCFSVFFDSLSLEAPHLACRFERSRSTAVNSRLAFATEIQEVSCYHVAMRHKRLLRNECEKGLTA
jgi:hypothetical protein